MAVTRQETLLEVLVALEQTGALRNVEIDTRGETTTIEWDAVEATLIRGEKRYETRRRKLLTVTPEGRVTEEALTDKWAVEVTAR